MNTNLDILKLIVFKIIILKLELIRKM